MSTRSNTLVAALVTGVGALVVGNAGPALAQGDPVGGYGNHYYFAGAGNGSGQAVRDFRFGDPGDVVLVGDWDGDGTDGLIVRRGNRFFVRNELSSGVAEEVFSYGNPGDTVLVGDWDGDGTDTLAVRRGNRYFVKNDVTTGTADYDFSYGDPGDQVLVGNWDGDTGGDDDIVTTDTLTVRRGNDFYVKNSTTTGPADYWFTFGNPGDPIVVGDWAGSTVYDDPSTPAVETTRRPGYSSDGVDQLAARHGNRYYLSGEVDRPGSPTRSGFLVGTIAIVSYGEPSDAVFTAQLPYTYDENGTPHTLFGDGLAVRRND